jgi:TonB family protein
VNSFESWVLEYLLNSLWQVPLVFLAAWLVARLVRRTGAQMEHRVWVSALLLELILPACSLHPGDLLRELWGFVLSAANGNPAGGQIRVVTAAGTTHGNNLLRLSSSILHGVTAVYGCTLLYIVVRLAWGLWNTDAMRRGAKSVKLVGDTEQSWNRYARIFGIEKSWLATSPLTSGPVTVGIRRGVLLLPPGFLEKVADNDLDSVLTHEFAHMQRHDFVKNLVYELLSLPIAWHPVRWLTRSRIAESREMVCDGMAAEAVAGREKYARSLLRLASMLANRTPARTLHAIGIFDANIFERRVMNLTRKHVEINRVRRLTIAVACAAVALATCASALALRMEVAAAASTSPDQIHPKPKVSGAVISGNKISGVNPIYPAQARADKVEGAVVLSITIDKDGVPTNIQVKKSVRADLDESAVTAVSQWRYKPYLLNGNPTEVDSTVTITYSLAP